MGGNNSKDSLQEKSKTWYTEKQYQNEIRAIIERVIETKMTNTRRSRDEFFRIIKQIEKFNVDDLVKGEIQKNIPGAAGWLKNLEPVAFAHLVRDVAPTIYSKLTFVGAGEADDWRVPTTRQRLAKFRIHIIKELFKWFNKEKEERDIMKAEEDADTKLVTSKNVKDFDWPFKKKPEDIVHAFHAKYTDAQIGAYGDNTRDLDNFKLTFKQFEDALKNKTTLFVIEPQAFTEIKAMNLEKKGVRLRYLSYFYNQGEKRDSTDFATTGSGLDPWYVVDKKLYNDLFPSTKTKPKTDRRRRIRQVGKKKQL